MSSSVRKGVKVSVCVVTYNHEKYIRQCLQSIVDQKTSFRFEVIVGEDCSKDGTRAIVQEFAEKYPDIIRPLLHEKNVGATNNYLSVLRLAEGELICNCDGDDYWLPSKLEAQVQFMEKHPECSVSGHRMYVTDDGERLSDDHRDHFPSVMKISAFYEHGNFLANSSTMHRASCNKIPDIKEETIDFLFHIWRVRDRHIGFINQYLGVYRRHGASMTSCSHQSLRYFNLNLAALNEIHKVVNDQDELEKRKFALCRDCIKNFIANDRVELAKEIARNSTRIISNRRHSAFLKLMVFFSDFIGFAIRVKRNRFG
ncbi:hypothetical protein GCM10027343_19210 [Noviherbaspirillum agri]